MRWVPKVKAPKVLPKAIPEMVELEREEFGIAESESAPPVPTILNAEQEIPEAPVQVSEDVAAPATVVPLAPP